MLELLEGRPTERVPLLLTPRMKDAANAMADRREQNLSEWLRHQIAKASEDVMWAVHVEGPDDIVARADYAAALEMATDLNDYYNRFKDSEPAIVAKVIEWPFSEVGHGQELAKGEDYGREGK